MSKIRGAIVINMDRCKGCCLCVQVCPLELLELAPKKVNRRGYPYVQQINVEKCTGCKSCAIICPDGCISVYRKKEE
jgi:2-oxoglutarate ferredoxin oxidoreductase subunit delta